ncbi:ribonucleoside-diphosphate reductase subunit alpha [Candidatus Woesearchaeota archaeon]|nr:ribonucleoside-diphosphate reductase subunit alpha [Candidatus Woesearchaeota archaeon]
MADGTMRVIKRTGEVVDFDKGKIQNAIIKAVRATKQELPSEVVDRVSDDVILEIQERFLDFYPNVENIQDVVEKHLVKSGLYEIAKEYILYRAQRQKAREEEKQRTLEKASVGKLTVKKRDGRIVLFDMRKVKECVKRASEEYENDISFDLIAKEVARNIYDGVTSSEVEKAIIMATVAFMEKDPAYSYVAGRLFLQKLYKEVIGVSTSEKNREESYRSTFIRNIRRGVDVGLLDKRMLDFNLENLAKELAFSRDKILQYMGLQTLYERYFLVWEGDRIELPQSFWMRVAMGLALEEKDKEAKAVEFYTVLSQFLFMSSTPTLFHSGLAHPQLSSCYLTTIHDDLHHIFKCLGDNAQLNKWSGGVGNDWSYIRSTGSWIKSTNVESQGVVPFLKIANDVSVAINRSGKRRGATCAYLETWHLDIEDFLDLRKNTGDERRRTHDMNTANWIPDTFMKRIINDENWTLFSPEEVPELHDSYGRKFEKRYEEYETMAQQGKIKKHKVVSARKLWKKMLSMLFETGHPWMTFKDPCNIRSPQDHVGVVHSSNLCTEITLNTSKDETAVCNLGSINLGRHVVGGKIDGELLAKTIKTGMRMLDNVIDINFYPTTEAQNSNMRHRPVGMGLMGLQDTLFKMDIPFDAPAALEFMDRTMEFFSYHAIYASSELARERGTYESYKGSKWDRGIFPKDTLDLLEQERGMKIEVNRNEHMDWTQLKEHVKKHGMRNSNTMAIAPTATISNITGCFPCIEPIYKNIYVKSNISGEFIIVNPYLMEDLKKRKLWNQEMLEQLKYYDGNVQMIAGIPQDIKDKYKEAFDIDPLWLVEMNAVRAKWLDQSQSFNVFMKGVSGSLLSDIYIAAWKKGTKTTYYLRSLAASQIEKSTLDANKYGFTQKREYIAQASTGEGMVAQVIAATPKACAINDPTCESCQ